MAPRKHWVNSLAGTQSRLLRTLGYRLLAVTTADTHTVDHVALLGLVAETTGLIGARWAGRAVDNIQLAVLPAPIQL